MSHNWDNLSDEEDQQLPLTQPKVQKPQEKVEKVVLNPQKDENKEDKVHKKYPGRYDMINQIKSYDFDKIRLNIFKLDYDAEVKDIYNAYKQYKEINFERVHRYAKGAFYLDFPDRATAIDFIKVSPIQILNRKFTMQVSERQVGESKWTKEKAHGHHKNKFGNFQEKQEQTKFQKEQEQKKQEISCQNKFALLQNENLDSEEEKEIEEEKMKLERKEKEEADRKEQVRLQNIENQRLYEEEQEKERNELKQQQKNRDDKRAQKQQDRQQHKEHNYQKEHKQDFKKFEKPKPEQHGRVLEQHQEQRTQEQEEIYKQKQIKKKQRQQEQEKEKLEENPEKKEKKEVTDYIPFGFSKGGSKVSNERKTKLSDLQEINDKKQKEREEWKAEQQKIRDFEEAQIQEQKEKEDEERREKEEAENKKKHQLELQEKAKEQKEKPAPPKAKPVVQQRSSSSESSSDDDEPKWTTQTKSNKFKKK